jgi:hypothetical protein
MTPCGAGGSSCQYGPKLRSSASPQESELQDAGITAIEQAQAVRVARKILLGASTSIKHKQQAQGCQEQVAIAKTVIQMQMRRLQEISTSGLAAV